MLNAVKLESSGITPAAPQVVYKLRDISAAMVKAWEHAFPEHPDGVEVSLVFFCLLYFTLASVNYTLII